MNIEEKIAALSAMYEWAENKSINKITVDSMSIELTDRNQVYDPLEEEQEEGYDEIDEGDATKYDPDYLIKNAKNLF